MAAAVFIASASLSSAEAAALPGAKCAASSHTGWPYAAFELDSNATHVIVTHGEIPAGLIADCLHNSGARTISVSWSAPGASPARDAAATPAVVAHSAAPGLPPCTSASFPIPYFALAAGAICGDYPPWCSRELCLDFEFHFEAEGLVPAVVPIDCQC